MTGTNFHAIQAAHWKRLPYWVFAPVFLALGVAVGLVWEHRPHSPVWAVAGTLACQSASLVLTAIYWGRWQGALSRDPRGPSSHYLTLILRTHWVRTALINGSAFILLIWALLTLGAPL